MSLLISILTGFKFGPPAPHRTLSEEYKNDDDRTRLMVLTVLVV